MKMEYVRKEVIRQRRMNMNQSMINKEEVLSMLTSIQFQLEELERTIDYGSKQQVKDFMKEQALVFRRCDENVTKLEQKWKLVRKPVRKGRLSMVAIHLVSKLG